ncbi:hypothetical protein D3C72_2124260 [compost metagenome]
MDPKRLFATAIRLAWHINHRHNRAFHGVIRIGGNGFADHFRQRPAFHQTHFTKRSTREMVMGIRHHGNKTYRFAVDVSVCRLHGRAQA